MPVRISDEARGLIVRMLKEDGDRPTSEIAKETGVSEPTVIRVLRAEGLTRPVGRPMRTSPGGDRIRAEVAILSEQGLSIPEIALQVDRKERTVRFYLAEFSTGNEEK